jgi:hypothetical protein
MTNSNQQPVTREELEAALNRLRSELLDAFRKADPVLWSLLTAPADDEPDSDAERAEAAEGYAAIQRGEGTTLDDLKRELGL